MVARGRTALGMTASIFKLFAGNLDDI